MQESTQVLADSKPKVSMTVTLVALVALVTLVALVALVTLT
jgi:hypothetical protein